MIMLLSALVLIGVTFLITDYRRHLEIEKLKHTHKVQLQNLVHRSYMAGLKIGAEDKTNRHKLPIRIKSN